MKKLTHKKWLSIPIIVFLVLVLSAGAVFASTFVGPENQIIIQTINDAPVDINYGSIEATNHITLRDVEVGGHVDQKVDGVVIVVITEAGADLWLNMTLDPTTVGLYDGYTLALQSWPADHPMGTAVLNPWVRAGWSLPDQLHDSVQLTIAGTYTFKACVFATAGDTGGTANVKVTYILEDTP